MQFVILDLEWNGSYSRRRKKFINEIIEFGAVKLSCDLHITETFSMLVNPQVGKKINDRIEALTHISNEELRKVDNTFTHVLRKFRVFAKNCVLLTWGTADILTLLDNYEYFLKQKKIDFAQQYVDLQHYCEQMLGHAEPSKQMGLSTAAQALSIDFEEEALHRALADSMLAARCFQKLYDKARFEPFIQNMDDEFYRRLTFKTTILSNIKNPLIDKSQMVMYCEGCGQAAKRKSPWVVKNKSFRARFFCRNCNREYEARVQFKLKYDGVSVHKFMRVLEDTGE